MPKKKISIVIPIFNEENNIEFLTKEIVENADLSFYTYEIIFINDGSTDDSQTVLEKIKQLYPAYNIKIILLRKNYGKAVALHTGFFYAAGDVIITLDADMQDDPAEMKCFMAKINEGYDLVSGWKENRKDSFVKNQTSKIYNFFTSIIFSVKLHDHNCGFKAYTRSALTDLNIYGQLHRFIPVLIHANGYTKITEIKIAHRKRQSGATKYGPRRFLHGFLDILTIFFIVKYKSSPLHFFGSIGLLFLYQVF